MTTSSGIKILFSKAPSSGWMFCIKTRSKRKGVGNRRMRKGWRNIKRRESAKEAQADSDRERYETKQQKLWNELNKTFETWLLHLLFFDFSYDQFPWRFYFQANHLLSSLAPLRVLLLENMETWLTADDTQSDLHAFKMKRWNLFKVKADHMPKLGFSKFTQNSMTMAPNSVLQAWLLDRLQSAYGSGSGRSSFRSMILFFGFFLFLASYTWGLCLAFLLFNNE